MPCPKANIVLQAWLFVPYVLQKLQEVKEKTNKNPKPSPLDSWSSSGNPAPDHCLASAYIQRWQLGPLQPRKPPLVPYSCACLWVRTSAQALAKSLVWGSFPLPIAFAAAAKSLQSCPTLCDPMDSSPPGSSVHGIFQTRVLEWGAIAFSAHCFFYPPFPHPVTEFPSVSAARICLMREALSSKHCCPAQMGETARSMVCGGNGGFYSSPLLRNCQSTIQLPSPASHCCSYWATLWRCCLPKLSQRARWRQGLLPGISGPSPSSCPLFLALFPVITKPMSHSSVQLFLLECEGFSGYKLYLAKVKVCIAQSVGHRIQSLNILVLVFLLHSSTNGFFQT